MGIGCIGTEFLTTGKSFSDIAKETKSQRFKPLQLPRKLITSVQKIWLFKATLITL